MGYAYGISSSFQHFFIVASQCARYDVDDFLSKDVDFILAFLEQLSDNGKCDELVFVSPAVLHEHLADFGELDGPRLGVEDELAWGRSNKSDG
jgi:hypothetical protein